jgi:hypothetical protein
MRKRGPANGTKPGTVVTLHWNGTTWSKFSLPAAAENELPVTDGHGGYRVAEYASGVDSLYHVTGGHWIKLPLPVKRGYKTYVGPPLVIPGTASFIANGSFVNAKTSASEDGIFTYTP